MTPVSGSYRDITMSQCEPEDSVTRGGITEDVTGYLRSKSQEGDRTGADVKV